VTSAEQHVLELASPLWDAELCDDAGHLSDPGTPRGASPRRVRRCAAGRDPRTGYIVEREACELDADRFAELLRAARAAVAADELDEALKAFDEALSFWRGEALGDLALEGDARSAAARLDDQRRAAGAERVDVALALGRHHELIPDLERPQPRPDRHRRSRAPHAGKTRFTRAC
jgi:hypothetical protein